MLLAVATLQQLCVTYLLVISPVRSALQSSGCWYLCGVSLCTPALVVICDHHTRPNQRQSTMVYANDDLFRDCSVGKGRLKLPDGSSKDAAYREVWTAVNRWIQAQFEQAKVRQHTARCRQNNILTAARAKWFADTTAASSSAASPAGSQHSQLVQDWMGGCTTGRRWFPKTALLPRH